MAREEAGQLQIKTLGGLSTERDGVVIDSFASRKAEALIVYLACNPRTHRREVLAELLWDDRSQRQAMANLRVVLSSLRKEVGDYVEITRTTASIAAGAALRLDVSEMEAAATRFREHDGHFSSDLAEELAVALAGYEGDFLEGFFIPDAGGFEAWATAERERLHRLAGEALQSLGRWYLDQAKYAEAIATSSRLLELDPLAEVGYRQLMEALAHNSQRSQALATYERLVETLRRELAVEPSSETLELVEAIRADTLEPVLAISSPKESGYSLPVPATPLIGRETELDELNKKILDDGTRLLSIVAPGGMGKTHLALEVAHLVVDHFSDRAAFVSLAPISEIDAIAPAVASALRYNFRGGGSRGPEAQLLHYLRDKELLLVLDNFEHLLDAAPLLIAIVRTAPAVKVLVTSRERLRLQAEHVYPLRDMAFRQWETVADAQDDPVVQLFLYHARRVRPSFSLREEHLVPLQQIFHIVGGMPLAVILAAGWVEVLSPAEIAAEIGSNLDLLEAMNRDVPVRHQSMRAVVEGMWVRLSEHEQRLYAALSVFRGGFTLKAARQIVGASPRDLMRLVEHSLLSRAESGRFEQHELLRQCGEEYLEAYEDADSIRDSHAAFFTGILQEWAPHLYSSRQMEAVHAIDADFENLAVAWRWASARDQTDLLLDLPWALAQYAWRGVNRIYRVQALLERTLRAREGLLARSDLLLRAQSLLAIADFGFGVGISAQRAVAMAEEGRAIMHEFDDPYGIAYAKKTLGWWQVTWMGDAETGVQLLREAHHQFAAEGARFNQVQSLMLMTVGMTGPKTDLQVVRPLMQKGIAEAREVGDELFLAVCLYWYGELLLHLGEYAQAEQALEEARRLERGLGFYTNTVHILEVLALIARIRGDLGQAVALLHEALKLSRAEWDVSTLGVQAALADLRSVQGQHEQAKALLDQTNGGHVRLAFSYRQGDYAEALLIAERLLTNNPSIYTVISVALFQASISARQGDAHTAEVRFQQALGPTKRTSRRYLYGRAAFVAAEIRRVEGDLESAVELAALAYENPLTYHEYRQYAADLLVQLKAELSLVAYEMAYARGAAADIDGVIASLLVEEEA